MKLITSEMDAETEKWMEEAANDENNDIVKRAKNMSSMAYSMYQFTRGEGTLKTTQDLFTQAEYFAEEANRMYKTVRQFSYQVCLFLINDNFRILSLIVFLSSVKLFIHCPFFDQVGDSERVFT